MHSKRYAIQNQANHLKSKTQNRILPNDYQSLSLLTTQKILMVKTWLLNPLFFLPSLQ